MKVCKEDMLLYAVTDRSWLKETESLKDQVEKALKGGATFLQIREKGLSYEQFLSEANEIKKITDKYNVPLIINDNVEIARTINADGVHLGQEDLNIKLAREVLGSNKIIGISAHNTKEAIEAEKLGADYLGVGAVFSTSTKGNAKPLSNEELLKICKSVSIPVVAIGGITKDNIIKLKGSGIDGVAVVSAIFAQDDIEMATKEIAKLSREVVNS